MTNAGYKLYGISGAGSLVVEFLLEKGNVPYHMHYPDKAERSDANFRDMSPRGQIPVLVTPDGHAMTESVAIVTYLLEHHPEIGLIPPIGDGARGAVLQWLSFLAINLYTANQRYSQTSNFSGDKDVIINGGYEDRRNIYGEIELALNPYLCGDTVTAADLYLYMQLRWDRELKDVLAHHPNMSQLYKDISALDYVQSVKARQPARI